MAHRLPWRYVIDGEMERWGDSWDNVVQRNMTDEESTHDMIGNTPGERVPDKWTIWTHTRVYFPTVNDSRFGIASVPRNPCDERVEAVE